MTDETAIEELIERIVAGAPLRLDAEVKTLDLNKAGVHGRTPLMVAAAVGRFEAVEALVKSGASIVATGAQQLNALHEASAEDETRIAGYLLSLGADPNALTDWGVTPLMCAAAWGNCAVAKLLLENGADKSRVSRNGATAADIAREKGEDAVAKLIDAYGT
jgi:ankyrin repeat protein